MPYHTLMHAHTHTHSLTHRYVPLVGMEVHGVTSEASLGVKLKAVQPTVQLPMHWYTFLC